VASAINFAWVRSKSSTVLDLMTRYRWVDWLLVVAVIVLSLVAWQVKPLMQGPQALGECLQSEVLSVLSMPPACLEGVIKKYGNDQSVVLGILTLAAPAVAIKSKNAVWWCSTARLAYNEYDGRTRWSAWKQGLLGGDEQLVQSQLTKGRELCRAYPAGSTSMRNPVGSFLVNP
jgi:hypothetical protein